MDSVLGYVRSLLEVRVVRALLVGVVAALAQTIIFELVLTVFKLAPASTAVVLGAEFGILTNFYFNNRISFADRRHGDMFKRLSKLHFVVAGSVVIQWVCLFITEHQTSSLLLIHIAYLFSLALGFVWNYTWYSLWVWRHPTTTL